MSQLHLIAGHTAEGPDKGAVRTIAGRQETEGVIAERLKLKIAAHIHNLTGKLPDMDSPRETTARTIARLREQVKPTDIVLDIHLNATAEGIGGTECFIRDRHQTEAQRLGTALCSTTAAVLDIRNRGIKHPAQSARGTLGIFSLGCVVVLWEVCFLSNPADYNALIANENELCKKVAELMVSYNS